MSFQKIVSAGSPLQDLDWLILRGILREPEKFQFLARYFRDSRAWPNHRGSSLYIYGRRDVEGSGVTSPWRNQVARSLAGALCKGRRDLSAVVFSGRDFVVRRNTGLEGVLENMLHVLRADIAVINDLQLATDVGAQTRLSELILDRKQRWGFLILTGPWLPGKETSEVEWVEELSDALLHHTIHSAITRPRVYASASSAS